MLSTVDIAGSAEPGKHGVTKSRTAKIIWTWYCRTATGQASRTHWTSCIGCEIFKKQGYRAREQSGAVAWRRTRLSSLRPSSLPAHPDHAASNHPNHTAPIRNVYDYSQTKTPHSRSRTDQFCSNSTVSSCCGFILNRLCWTTNTQRI